MAIDHCCVHLTGFENEEQEAQEPRAVDPALIDRVAGLLVLLFGQQQSRIATMTTNQIIHRDDSGHLHRIPESGDTPLSLLAGSPGAERGCGR